MNDMTDQCPKCGGQLCDVEHADAIIGSGYGLECMDCFHFMGQERLRTFVDAAAAVCDYCAGGITPEPRPLAESSSAFVHLGVMGAGNRCDATRIWRIVRDEYGMDTIKKHSPRGYHEKNI